MFNKSSKERTITSLLFIAILAMLMIPFILKTEAATTGTFNVTLEITNAPPTVIWVNDSISLSPSEGSRTLVTVNFNASDNNSAADLDDTTAQVWINFSSETSRGNDTCAVVAESGNIVTYECTFYMHYWDADGAWTINASVEDLSGEYAQNLSATVTYGDLAAMQVIKANMTFDGVPGDENVSSAENPQIINNTGNRDFSEVNITAYELQGVTNPAYTIGAGNFSVNVSNSPIGQMMQNATSILIPDSTLPRGNQSTEDLYVYLDIPTGILGQTYKAAELWEIEVIQ